MQRDPGSVATVFRVTDGDGRTTVCDVAGPVPGLSELVPQTVRRLWRGEGWDVFCRSDGILEIERIDEPGDGPPAVVDDNAAVKHVVQQASAGSVSHLLALWLDGRSDAPPEGAHAWLPPILLDSLNREEP